MTPAGSDDETGRTLPPGEAERLKKRLSELDKRIEAKSSRGGPSDEELGRRSTALGKAMRLSTELVVGVFSGGVIGWLLDQWLGTMPLMLVVFLMLGVAAGLMNAVRTARSMSAKN